jgi:hypothetical protein
MADVAHGRSEWAADESAHLASCGSCAATWELVVAGTRLGRGLEGRLDTATIADRVVERLVEARRADRWRRTGLLVGLAAAAALVIAFWPGRSAAPHEIAHASQTLAVPLAELDGLDSGQLQAGLETLDAPLSSEASTAIPTLGDLDEQQMERVLRSLEG